jgi:hypothetical protein
MPIYDKHCCECGLPIGPIDRPAEAVNVGGEQRWRHQRPCPAPGYPTGERGLGAVLRASVGIRSEHPQSGAVLRSSPGGVGTVTARRGSHFEKESEIVRRLLALLGVAAPELSDPNDGRRSDTGVDVALALGGHRFGYQLTEYHAGTTPGVSGGSSLRREESRRARGSNTYAMYGHADPLAGLVAHISEKARQSLSHDFQEFDRVDLVVATNLPTWGASASTFLLEVFVDLAALERLTGSLLSSSRYAGAYVFVMQSASGRSSVFGWDRSSGWRRII